eukprot:1153051-Pelagomonas_calceolata.AAC.10
MPGCVPSMLEYDALGLVSSTYIHGCRLVPAVQLRENYCKPADDEQQGHGSNLGQVLDRGVCGSTPEGRIVTDVQKSNADVSAHLLQIIEDIWRCL